MLALDKLIKQDSDPQWQKHEKELNGAYNRIRELITEIEQSNAHYKELQDGIRPQVSTGLRKLRKAVKQ